MDNHWYPGCVYTYIPPTRLVLATRSKACAESDLIHAKRIVVEQEARYVKACRELTAAIADDRPKACTCCPTCGGTK
jgi:hypothetical protein